MNKNYQHLIPDFPEGASVRDDETCYGNVLISVLRK